MSVSWPTELRGVTESVVSTRGQNGRFNVAALGLFTGDPVTSTTWGNTRTRRNLHREGRVYVQFTRDPVDFVEAALSIYETDEPILDSADAWVESEVELLDRGTDDGTRWERWAHDPKTSRIVRRVVPSTNRGYYAVIDATIAASRLDVEAYDSESMRRLLAYFEETVDRCGGERELEAFDRLTTLTGWRDVDTSTTARDARTNR